MGFPDNDMRFCILYFKEVCKRTVHRYNRLRGHHVRRFDLYSTPVLTPTLELRLDTVFQEPIGHFQKVTRWSHRGVASFTDSSD